VRSREISGRADALRTLLIYTALQAFLLTVNLHLLPVWGDEASTLLCAAMPVSGILKFVRTDIHPPLYFLLAHAWLKLTGAADPLFALAFGCERHRRIRAFGCFSFGHFRPACCFSEGWRGLTVCKRC
jgi:hypothetical protein